MAQLIDGKELAKSIRARIKEEVSGMTVKPGLAVVLVGEDPASKVYVNSKEKACLEAGMYSKKVLLPQNASEKEVLNTINQLNRDPKVHGVLVQVPLPNHLNEEKIINAVSIEKDVDCFHKYNVGQLLLAGKKTDGAQLIVPCTPKGIISLIESTGQPIEGKKAVVIGRSNIVGKPIALLLLENNATVSICHSRTSDLKSETLSADILVVAIGKPKFITSDMVKKGSIIIDAGINRMTEGLVGDVDFESCKEVAGYITPVPGGVGPMTIASLLENTLQLAKQATAHSKL